MKNRLFLTSIAAALISALASAQERGANDPIPPVQPPPAMDDAQPAAKPATTPPPATKARATQTDSQQKPSQQKTVPLGNSDAEAAAAAAEAKKRAATPVPVLPPEPEKQLSSPGLPPEVQKAAEATELPVITVRQEGNQTITEYRKRGKLFAERISSQDSGDTKWYVDQRYKGPMPADPAAGVSGHVAPVEYKVFEWGN